MLSRLGVTFEINSSDRMLARRGRVGRMMEHDILKFCTSVGGQDGR